jgi:hypothetical protein
MNGVDSQKARGASMRTAEPSAAAPSKATATPGQNVEEGATYLESMLRTLKEKGGYHQGWNASYEKKPTTVLSALVPPGDQAG